MRVIAAAALFTLPLLTAANDTPLTDVHSVVTQTATPSSYPAQVADKISATTLQTRVPDMNKSDGKGTNVKAEDHNNDETYEGQDELKKRQAPGQLVGADVPKSPDPTQMSPVTTYMVYVAGGAQSPVVYTQKFSAVPEQWPAPKSGSVGLGTIQGQVGVVKTQSRRGLVAEATNVVKRSVHNVLQKRKKGGKGSGSHNAASGLTAPLVLTGSAALTALFVALAL